MDSGTKKYGLIVPKKRLDGVLKTTNVFGDSDSDDDAKQKPIQTNNQTKAQQRTAKIAIDEALKEDATVFQYDEVYDEMDKKKESLKETKNKVDKKPRYIQNLLVQAEKRKLEYERRNERIIQKEREQEGDEFRDKEAFVTSSYKKKLEELKKLDEEDAKFSLIEDINDITKQKDMGSFYRHLYKAELGKDDKDEAEKVNPKTIKKSDPNRRYRKRASSNSSSDDNADNDDRDTDISDSASSVDSLKRSKIHKSPKRRKSEEKNVDKSDDYIEEKIVETQEKSKTNMENKTPSNESKKIINETSEDEKIKKTESKPKKETVPKINIWEKRTVGDVYEAARQRYFERKMKQINIRV